MTQAEPGPQAEQSGAPSLSGAILGDEAHPRKTERSKSADPLLTSASDTKGASLLDSINSKRLFAAGLTQQQVAATQCFNFNGGLAFTYLDPHGKEYTYGEGKPFFRHRPNWSQQKQDEAAANLEELPKYLSPAGCRCAKPYHSPLHVQDKTYALRLKKSKYPIILPEGEIKAIVSSAHEVATGSRTVTIGLGGVSAFSDQRTPVDEDGDRQLIPELLNEVEWQQRDVYIVFDSDLIEKLSVRCELEALAIALHKLGARPWLVRLPQELPGTYQDPKNGLDDFIIRHGYDAFLKLLRSATQLEVTYKNLEGGAKQYLVKNFGGEPSGKSESHIKALMAWSVLKESIAVRHAVGVYQWQGTHWQEQEGKAREALARQQEDFYDAQQWINRVGAVFNNSTAEIERRLSVPKHSWQPRHLLTFTNCVLDTLTGETRPHDRSTFTTGCLPYPYDTSAQCPLWLKFLKEALSGDDNLIALSRALFRWCLMPKDTSQQFEIDKAFNAHGLRGSGKGTFASTLRVVVGPENVGAGGPDVFGDKEKLARLVDKKVAMDMDAKGFLPSSTNFNKVVSNEPVTVERKYRDSDDIPLGVVVFWASNDPIRLQSDGSEGVGRRLVTLPFNNRPKTVDPKLKSKLAAEAAGIFQWAWSMPEDEMRAVLLDGVKSASAIEAAVDQHLYSNPVLMWLSEEKPDGTFGFVSVRGLFKEFQRWALEANTARDMSEKALAKELQKVIGVGFKRSNGSKFNLPPMRRKLDRLPTENCPNDQPFYDYAAHLGIGTEAEAADGSPQGAESVHLDSSSDRQEQSVQQPVQPKTQSTTGFTPPISPFGQIGQISKKTFSNQEGMGGYPPQLKTQCDLSVQLSNLSNPSVPEPLVNPECSTVRVWVSAAIDGLGYVNATVDEDSIHAVIESWASAPAISRAQVRSALKRIKPTQQDDFF